MTSWLARSACPLAWGWYPNVRLTVTPIFSMKLANTRDVNCGPLSLTICSGMPKYRNTCWKRSSNVVKADGMAGSGMRRRDFENR